MTRDFSGLDQNIPCEIGTVLVYSDRIEMAAKKVNNWEQYCLFPVSDATLEIFRASVDLQVKGKNFLIGLALGDITDSSSGKLVAYLATMTTESSSGKWWNREKNESWIAWLGENHLSKDKKSKSGWMENLWCSEDEETRNPTTGTLEFVKDDAECDLF